MNETARLLEEKEEQERASAVSRKSGCAGSLSYATLFDFYSSVLCLYVEGVEFMDHEEIFQAVKKDVFGVANS